MKGLRTIGNMSSSAVLVAALGYGTVAAAPLNLSDAPLFLGGNIEPNVVFNLDDSGSMQFEYMPEGRFPAGVTYYGIRFDATSFLFPHPDSGGYFPSPLNGVHRPVGIYGGGSYINGVPNFFDKNLHNFYMRSAHNNPLFYNPGITYRPWANSNGSGMAPANPQAALYNPRLPAKGSLNLTQSHAPSTYWFGYCGADESGTCPNTGTYTADNTNTAFCQAESATQTLATSLENCFKPHTYWPSTYFNYKSGVVTRRSSYDKIEIRTSKNNYAGSPNRTDCQNAPSCTYQEEIQNFANWFQYYRSRILAARAGIGRAFADQGSSMRVGFAAINKPGAIVRGVQPFSDTNKATFFNDLYDHVIDPNGTPLRRAMDDVGQYFMRQNDGPWENTPGVNGSNDLECRQSYQVLMTDGYWNGAEAPTPGARANVDNESGLSINHPKGAAYNYQYTPTPPYRDAHADTLADIGMYYWNRDLRTDLANKVPTNPNDPAFWQHLVNFTVGLGVNGTLNPANGLPASWPLPCANCETNIDDLWHTAVNSRGGFFSTSEPDIFARALSDTLASIVDRTSSAAPVSLNSGSLSNDTRLYQARFDSGGWRGQLFAYRINSDGTVGAKEWDAGAILDSQDWSTGRRIVTYKPSTDKVIPFRWPVNPSSPTATELDAAQVTALNTHPVTGLDSQGQNRLEFLRGKIVTGLRTRSSKLGDIVNSGPVYVGSTVFNYYDNWGTGAPENASPYSTFRSSTAYKSRNPMLYVGANDGMLHAFDANTGTERFAYVPSAVFTKLNELTRRDYTHRYYVDGSPTAVDAFVSGSWRTILAGGLRGGGKAVYWMDITTPPGTSDSETTIANRTLWEYTSADNGGADLGFTFGEVNIVRMHNGNWAAVFGNGYNSTNQKAVLYIVDLATGVLLKKIDTLAGSTSQPNGLATPAPVDINGDFIVDYIYAGDLLGNLWKFDVTSNTASSWSVAYNGNSLFQAKTPVTNEIQPITVRPQIGLHPTGRPQDKGVMVYFGTGKYVEIASIDNTPVGQKTQTFYGIWDRKQTSLTAFTRAHLLKQEITNEPASNGFKVRVTSDNAITWHTGTGNPSGSPPTSHLGWFIDLINKEDSPPDNKGERQVANPILRNGRIIFTTLVPALLQNACDSGGSGWLMELDAADGSRLAFVPFDLDGDGEFDNDDRVLINGAYVNVSGLQSTVGIIGSPGFVAGNDPVEYTYTSGGGDKGESGGELEKMRTNAGPQDLGRQTWRQLR